MNSKLRFYVGAIFILVVLNMTCRRSLAQDATPPASGDAAKSTAKLYGEFVLTTNYVDKAISRSNNSFAMQPEIGYAWGEKSRIGVWGSNVQYPTNSESLNLRLFGWYKFIFSQNYDLKVRGEYNKFFASNMRDGIVLHFDFNWSTHHIILEQMTNWYGTGSSALWLGYDKSWKIIWDMDYKINTGFTIVNVGSYSSYLDFKTGLGYKYSDLYYELMMSFNSAAGQFSGGVAEVAFWLSVTAKF